MVNYTPHTRHNKTGSSPQKPTKQTHNNTQALPESLDYLQRVLGERAASQIISGNVDVSNQVHIQRTAATDENTVIHLQRMVGNQRTLQLLRTDTPTIQHTTESHDTIQRIFGFGKKKKKARTSEPGMYRTSPGEVKKAGSMTFFEMPTSFRKVSGNRHILSEVGAGTNPLALMGTPSEIAAWLSEHSNGYVTNIISDTDDNDYDNPTDIYMQVKKTKGLVPITRENVRALTPLHDAGQAIAEFAIGMGGAAVGGLGSGGGVGTMLTDTAGAFKDLSDQAKWVKEHGGSKGKKSKGPAMEPMYMVQFWIGGGQKIATRATHGADYQTSSGKRRETQITFSEIAGLLAGQLK